MFVLYSDFFVSCHIILWKWLWFCLSYPDIVILAFVWWPFALPKTPACVFSADIFRLTDTIGFQFWPWTATALCSGAGGRGGGGLPNTVLNDRLVWHFPLITCPFSPCQPVAATHPPTHPTQEQWRRGFTIGLSISKGWAIHSSFSSNGTKQRPGGEIWRKKKITPVLERKRFCGIGSRQATLNPLLFVMKWVGRN